jgi:hypothetical protein
LVSDGPVGRGRGKIIWCVKASLDEIFAFRFRDHGLQLGGGKGVYVASLRCYEEKHLRAGESAQFVRLFHYSSFALTECDMSVRGT